MRLHPFSPPTRPAGRPAANNDTLAEVMSSYWISFAITGDPNPMKVPQAPFWESYMGDGPGSTSNGESIGFQTQYVTYTSIKPRVDPDANEGCEFFGAHGYDVMN